MHSLFKSISDIFFTERNLTIITFNAPRDTAQEQATVRSVGRRVSKLLAKNVLPVNVGLLAFSDVDLDQSSLEKYYNLIVAELKKTQNEIRNLFQSYRK